jgi:hypothetical protein
MIVRIHRRAEPSLLAWARSLAAEPAEALAFADLYYDSIERELVRTNGRPGRAVRIPAIEPETWLWDFQAGRYWIV